LKKTSEDGKPSMFVDWQNQHCENCCTTKSHLNAQCNPYQNPNEILHRNRKINFKMHMETQKTSNNQTILSKKSNTGGITIPNFKATTQP
jgi:hypothetical protein